MGFFKRLSFFCAAAALIFSCASTSAAKGGKGGKMPDDVAAAREKALAARASCAEAGADRANLREWNLAEKALSAAEGDVRAARRESAVANYGKAARIYEWILKSSQADSAGNLAERRAAIEKKIGICEEEGYSHLAKSEFDIGFVLFSRACAEMDGGEFDRSDLAAKFDEAESHIDAVLKLARGEAADGEAEKTSREAKSDIAPSEVFGEAERLKGEAIAAKSECGEAEKASREAKSDVASAEIFGEAERLKGGADSDFNSGRYGAAAEKYRLSALKFAEADRLTFERREAAAQKLGQARAAAEESQRYALDADEISAEKGDRQ